VLGRTSVSRLLRASALVVVTLVAFVASWQLASSVAAERATVASQSRAETSARGGDYGYLGVSEALTVPTKTRASLNGQMVVFGLGVPLTVVDGLVTLPVRVPRATTVTEALRLAGVQLGPLDRVAIGVRQDSTVASGDVLRVVRVTETDVVVRENVPFAVQTVEDPTLAAGRTLVTKAGVPGVLENTYRIQSADGAEEGRTLIVSVRLSEPVAEVRHLGTKVVVIPPPAGGDMEAIIRAAAARYGADPTQLLRVAYCESRYNPSAYNRSSGASGLFQFLATTWAANSVRAGYAGASVFDPVANANTAAWMFARQQAGQWSCK
jgi:hypothetical protein